MKQHKAILYCRVSDVRGNKRRDEWDSIPRQRAALLELAQRHGMLVVDVYEEAMSGAKERPQFEQMMAQLRAGEANTVLVTTFDRLTRTEQLGEFEMVKAELRRLGCELFTYDMGQMPMDGKADSELMTDMRASVSKFERLKIRERTLSAREAGAKAGRWTGHAAPFGYRTVFDPVTGARTFEIDEEQAAAVRAIFDRYLAGEGTRDIALGLQAEGIRAPRGVSWSKPTIRYILRNPLYAGVAVFRKPYNRPNDQKSGPIITAASTAFDPIIPLAVFERAQVEKAGRQVVRRQGPGTPHPLSGLLRCNQCHGTMGYAHIGPGRYRCQTNDSYPGRCLAPQSYTSEQANAVVLRFLKRELPRHIDRQRLLQVQREEHEAPEPDALTPLRMKLADAERMRESVVRKVAEDVLSKEDAEFTLRGLRKEIEDQRMHIAALERSQRTMPSVKLADLQEIVDALETYDESEEREELRELFEAALLQVYLVRNGRDPGDRRRWRVDVSKALLVTGDEIRRG